MTASILIPSRTSSTHLLARLLVEPELPARIQALEAPAFARLLDRVGLEDAGELVAFATTEQLVHVFDEDLWQSERPGEDARFDADRFAVWLEVMLEAGDAFVAAQLAELPEDLVTLAFHKQVLVVDLEVLMTELQEADDADATEKALSDCLGEEIDTFQVIARRPQGWDAVLASLLALDRDHHDVLVRLLERCAAMSAEQIDDGGGLYAILTEEEMLENDVAGDREDRRGEAGHVSPSAAAGFLKLARDPETSAERDALTRAYFRDLAPPIRPASARPASAAPTKDRLDRLLAEATHAPASPPLLTGGDATTTEPVLTSAMRELAHLNPILFAQRSEEIAYLANVLAAGCAYEGRRLRPIEATRAALATCSLGLELASGPPLATLQKEPADVSFRRAWARLAQLGARTSASSSDPLVVETLAGLRDDCPSLRGSLSRTPRFFATIADVRAANEFLDRLGPRRRR